MSPTTVDLLVLVAALTCAASCRGWVYSGHADLRRSGERWNAWGTVPLLRLHRRFASFSRKEAIVWTLHASTLALLAVTHASSLVSERAAAAQAVTWAATTLVLAAAAALLLRASSIWRKSPSIHWVAALPVAAGLLSMAAFSTLRGRLELAPEVAAAQTILYVIDASWYAGSVFFLVGLPFLDSRLDRRWSSGLFAYAVPRELSLLCGGAMLPFVSVFAPSPTSHILLGLGLLAVAGTAWRPYQISRLRLIPFVVILAHAACRPANSSTSAIGQMLASGQLITAFAYLVYAFGVVERARAYARTEPLLPYDQLAEARTFDLGSVKISVMHGSTPDSEGTTVRIHGLVGDTETEALRFDCFEVDPHFHYDPDGRDEQHPIDENGGDDRIARIAWIVACLEHDLARMLTEAGCETLARQIDESRLREQPPAIRTAMHAAYGR